MLPLCYPPGACATKLSSANHLRPDNNHNGWIKDYTVHVSADGKTWGPPVAQSAFKKDDRLHTIRLASPVETRFLKLVTVSSFDPAKSYASLAELSEITAE